MGKSQERLLAEEKVGKKPLRHKWDTEVFKGNLVMPFVYLQEASVNERLGLGGKKKGNLGGNGVACVPDGRHPRLNLNGKVLR